MHIGTHTDLLFVHMQLSTVCRNCATAVQALMLQYSSFSVGDVEDKQPCMSSQLMLQWAPTVKKLFVYDDSCSQQGMRRFLSAAINLTEVELAVDVVLSHTAHMDYILCASSSLVIVRCRGLYLPAQLPAQLQKLQTCLEPTYIERPKKSSLVLQARFEGLLTVVAGMRELQELDIAIKSLADLRSSVQLPQLAELTLRLRLAETLHLVWVRKQRCGRLTLHMEIWTWETSIYVAALKQLKRLNISRLIVSDSMGYGRRATDFDIMARCADLAAARHFKLDVLG